MTEAAVLHRPPKKRPRSENNNGETKAGATTAAAAAVAHPTIPSLQVNSNGDSSSSSSEEADFVGSDEFAKAFDTFQAVHLPSVCGSNKKKKKSSLSSDLDDADPLTWNDLGTVYQQLNAEDQASWCIETTASSAVQGQPDQQQQQQEEQQQPKHFLQPKVLPTDPVAYCSFLVQQDKVALEAFLQRVPVERFSWNSWDYEPCVWVFFGRNHPPKGTCSSSSNSGSGMETEQPPQDLQGRPEHTDSISHDGTWHYQLSGTKRWLLRPTAKLMERLQEQLSEDDFSSWSSSSEESHQIQVDCHAGDVLVINTRLWKHQTVIPPQPEPSVSYARDFWVHPKKSPSGNDDGASSNDNANDAAAAATMTNVDGLYAADDIDQGTIIFKEADMPDCELHRSSTNANCEVVELEDGTGAIVSSRPIAAGEFFCVVESSDEEEEEEEGDFEEEQEESD